MSRNLQNENFNFNEYFTNKRIKLPARLLFKHENLISHSIFDNAREEIEKTLKVLSEHHPDSFCLLRVNEK